MSGMKAKIALRQWPRFMRWLGWPTKTRSTTTPWGFVYLRDTAWSKYSDDGSWPSPAVKALIAHEADHVRQMKAHRGWVFGPWLWTLRYLLSAKFRLLQEIEAEAVEAWKRASLLGVPVEAHHVSHGLRPGGVYKLPKGTDKTAITADVLARAEFLERAELAKEERRLWWKDIKSTRGIGVEIEGQAGEPFLCVDDPHETLQAQAARMGVPTALQGLATQPRCDRHEQAHFLFKDGPWCDTWRCQLDCGHNGPCDHGED